VPTFWIRRPPRPGAGEPRRALDARRAGKASRGWRTHVVPRLARGDVQGVAVATISLVAIIHDRGPGKAASPMKVERRRRGSQDLSRLCRAARAISSSSVVAGDRSRAPPAEAELRDGFRREGTGDGILRAYLRRGRTLEFVQSKRPTTTNGASVAWWSRADLREAGGDGSSVRRAAAGRTQWSGTRISRRGQEERARATFRAIKRGAESDSRTSAGGLARRTVPDNAVKVSAAGRARRPGRWPGSKAYEEEQAHGHQADRPQERPRSARGSGQLGGPTLTARCRSYPSGRGRGMRGNLLNGDGDDISQWALVRFHPGVRTCPPGQINYI